MIPKLSHPGRTTTHSTSRMLSWCLMFAMLSIATGITVLLVAHSERINFPVIPSTGPINVQPVVGKVSPTFTSGSIVMAKDTGRIVKQISFQAVARPKSNYRHPNINTRQPAYLSDALYSTRLRYDSVTAYEMPFVPDVITLKAMHLTVSYHDAPVRYVLTDLSERTGLMFSYPADAVASCPRVTIKHNDWAMHDLLDKILTPCGLRFEKLQGARMLAIYKL